MTANNPLSDIIDSVLHMIPAQCQPFFQATAETRDEELKLHVPSMSPIMRAYTSAFHGCEAILSQYREDDTICKLVSAAQQKIQNQAYQTMHEEKIRVAYEDIPYKDDDDLDIE